MNDNVKMTFGGIVKEYMTSPILSVDNDATLKEVADFMNSDKTSVVLVRNKNHGYIGVVTDADFTHKVAVKEYSVNTTTIESIMSAPIKAVDGSMFMADANGIIRQSGIRHLAVTENGEFIGLLSAMNFFEYYKDVEEHLSNLAINDGLTGIYNRRYFDETLAREWKRTMREKAPLSLIMLDIDYFKKYNDTYGHQAGDECLRQVATTISGALRRPADMAARYGGEEFVVVLPNLKLEDSAKFGETIRAKIEALKMEHKQSDANPFITVSLGIASVVPSSISSYEELVGAADKALYSAKNKGRNRVCVAQD
jgi:diguanylate cyclase (GGDEF)-like protein